MNRTGGAALSRVQSQRILHSSYRRANDGSGSVELEKSTDG